MYKGAIIGFGGMARMHFNVVGIMEDMAYTGVYDVAEKANRDAAEAGLTVYESAEALLQDASVNFVLVATPNCYHKDYVIAALRAGKAVICEKPVTMNAKELEEIMAVQKETGASFTIHQNRRWDKDYCMVKKAIDDGMIGKPYYIESRVQGSRGIPGDWRCVKEAGGGMMLDWGVHLIDQMLQMVQSPVVELYAIVLEERFESDDNFKLLLTFENGVTAQIQVDTNCFISLPRWHVSGLDGTLVVEDWSCNGKIVVPSKTETVSFDEYLVVTTAGTTRTMAPRPPESMDTLPLPEVSPEWSDYYKNFFAHLDKNEPLLVTPEQALRVMKIMDYAFESSKEGKAIRCKL